MARKGMVDLGRKPQKGEIAPRADKAPEIYYPSLYIDNKDLGLGDKDVGKTIVAVVELKIKEVAKRINEKRKVDNATFDILGINLSPKRTSHYGKEEE